MKRIACTFNLELIIDDAAGLIVEYERLEILLIKFLLDLICNMIPLTIELNNLFNKILWNSFYNFFYFEAMMLSKYFLK